MLTQPCTHCPQTLRLFWVEFARVLEGSLHYSQRVTYAQPEERYTLGRGVFVWALSSLDAFKAVEEIPGLPEHPVYVCPASEYRRVAAEYAGGGRAAIRAQKEQ